MSEPSQTDPPRLRDAGDGSVDTSSLADVVEWFLNFDERTARMRHPQVNELFLWKQQDDAEQGITTYPFENAEARFAIGVIQAVEQNENEPLLKLWMSDILGALQEARDAKNELTEAYKLETRPIDTATQKADKLTTTTERRMYLTSCWLDALLTAEVRVLGWIYQELYSRPFQP
ncbi:MAG TPA: hypothetical protein VGJ02_10330 [Pyrinomonadaceae bacterium]